MIRGRRGFLDHYKSMYSGYGVCALWFLGSLIYTLESQRILSKLRSRLLDARITNVFSHWQGSIDIMVLLTTADYHYIVQRYAHDAVDVVNAFFCYSMRLFVPLLVAFLLIKLFSGQNEERECWFLQGLFFMRALYPITPCSWSVTVYQSNLFFGILAVTVINLLHKLIRINVTRFVIGLYVMYLFTHFVVISLRLIWQEQRYGGAYENQSPFHYFLDYLHGILEIELNFDTTKGNLTRIPQQQVRQGTDLLIRSIGDLMFALIWCVVFLGIIPLNIISENYDVNMYLKIVITLFGRPAVVLFNQMFMELLLYDKTLFFKQMYENPILIEIGQNTQSIVLSYAISAHFHHGRTSNIQLGPNNIGTLALYLAGYACIIMSIAHVFNLLTRPLSQRAASAVNTAFQHFRNQKMIGFRSQSEF